MEKKTFIINGEEIEVDKLYYFFDDDTVTDEPIVLGFYDCQ